MNFTELLYRARQGDKDAILEIFEMYRPLLIKNALVEGIFDEDLYQELTAELLKCIRYFRPLINDFLRKMAKFRHQENQDVSAGTRIRFFIDKPAAMISFPRAVIKYL